MKPVVLHLVETFLERSEVFIYNVVTGHRDWLPVVLCNKSTNESEFPVSRLEVVPAPVSKRQPSWWLDQIVGRATGRTLWHRHVEKVLRSVRPAVIHAHFGQRGWAALPLKRRLGIPLVTTFYGYDMSVLPRLPGWNARLARVFSESDLILAEGEYMRQQLISLGVSASKVKIQRISIDVDRYPRWQPGLSGRKTVLFVGRFTEKKGLLPALTAVRDLWRRGVDFKFRIVGDGLLRPVADQFVLEHGLNDVVEFLGMMPHAAVMHELATAHVFLHPSRTGANGDSEGGAPTILLEAQAVGIPIVTTRHADIPNVCPARSGVWLNDEFDDVHLAENLFSALHATVGTDSAFVRAHHSVGGEVPRLEEHYRSVLIRSNLNSSTLTKICN